MRPILLLAVSSTFAAHGIAASCESLTSLSLQDAKITSARTVAAGEFSPPGGGRAGRGGASGGGPYQALPAFCRVAATLTPSADSDIRIEVWLPVAGWNKKLQAVGNGGWAGTISYTELAAAIKDGYAGVSTDTGHTGGGGSFALGHPEKLIDFAYRSEHEMTVKAKAILESFYGSAAQRAYWNGCSTGGRQGLKEAQKYPDDFDGIIAGDPANRTPYGFWNAVAMFSEAGSQIPASKLGILHKAAIEACDSNDGLKDGLISDPAKCKFDPAVLLCKDADGPACLTAQQVATAKKIYGGVRNSAGVQLFPAFLPGSEAGWTAIGNGPGPGPGALTLDQLRYVVYKDPDWDWHTFDFSKDGDIRRFELPENLIMNATDPNLKAFFAHNGKLILYHGWADPQVPPLSTVEYYQSAVAAAGGVSKADNEIRLFLAPGMGHCNGGDGPNVFDKIDALNQWVEHGNAPATMIATHSTGGKPDRTRPLCPYPQAAVYKGSGSIDDAVSFVCKAP
jgi:feruloyl esterase